MQVQRKGIVPWRVSAQAVPPLLAPVKSRHGGSLVVEEGRRRGSVRGEDSPTMTQEPLRGLFLKRAIEVCNTLSAL